MRQPLEVNIQNIKVIVQVAESFILLPYCASSTDRNSTHRKERERENNLILSHMIIAYKLFQ